MAGIGVVRPPSSVLLLTCLFIAGAFLQASMDPDEPSSIAQGRKARIHLIPPSELPPLKVKNVYIKSADPLDGLPTAVVKFAIVNTGPTGVIDIVFEVSIIEKPEESSVLPTDVLAGPYNIHVKAALEAGYSMEYELRLRNVSADCNCVATVVVLSARPVVENASLQPH